MKLHGLQKMTLLDFPGRVACTVFLGQCDISFKGSDQFLQRHLQQIYQDSTSHKHLLAGLRVECVAYSFIIINSVIVVQEEILHLPLRPAAGNGRPLV